MVPRILQRFIPIAKKITTYTVIVALTGSLVVNYVMVSTATGWIKAYNRLHYDAYAANQKYLELEYYCRGETNY